MRLSWIYSSATHVCLSVCLSVCVVVCLFIYLSVCLFICLSVHCNVDLPMDPPSYVVTDCDSLVDLDISYETETYLDLEDSDDDMHEGCYTVVQTWTVTATDWCGQSTTETCERNIHVQDETAPEISGEGLVDVSCDDWAQYADSILVEANDNCDSEVTITMVQNMASGICPESYLRSYTAVDDCGNETTFEQVIRVFDWAPPTVTIECPPIFIFFN